MMDGTTQATTAEPRRADGWADEWAGKPRHRFLNRTRPGWWFHLTLALATLPLLWAVSSPAGGTLNWTLVSLGMLAIGALSWTAWLINWFARRRSDRPRTSGLRFLIAPLGACLFGALVLTHAPLLARWNHAQPVLDEVAANAPPARTDGRPLEFEVPTSAGTYLLDHAVRVGDDIFIYLQPSSGGSSGFLVDSGFAYLPNGPDPTQADPVTGAHSSRTRLATNGDETVVTHLTGDWYTWASYW